LANSLLDVKASFNAPAYIYIWRPWKLLRRLGGLGMQSRAERGWVRLEADMYFFCFNRTFSLPLLLLTNGQEACQLLIVFPNQETVPYPFGVEKPVAVNARRDECLIGAHIRLSTFGNTFLPHHNLSQIQYGQANCEDANHTSPEDI
jgi:hypothetical protein